jgi:quinolinate synthase
VNLSANAKSDNAVKVMIFPVDMMSNIATILSAERSIVLAAMSSFPLTK